MPLIIRYSKCKTLGIQDSKHYHNKGQLWKTPLYGNDIILQMRTNIDYLSIWLK
ncbi:MAG: hypothetical protein J5826_06615 [Bacteroidales bacterium]|nr:hypothetical protein [Bacteroidales bacterium]